MDSQGQFVSVAAFFRDARRVGDAAQLPRQDAAAILGRFFQNYTYEACSADQLLALADIAVRARDSEVARDALTRAGAMPGRAHLAYYKLGRLELGIGNVAEADAFFSLGTQADPEFAYNWMGRARALAASGRLREAAEPADRFLAFNVVPHSRDDMAALAEIADYLFENGERLRAAPAYALLRTHAPFSQKAAVRQAEAMISSGQLTEALELLRGAHASTALDLWGRRALAHCESHAGNHETALALVEGVIAERPTDAGFIATYLDVLVRGRDTSRWADALSRHADILPADGRAELEARLHLSAGNTVAACRVLAGKTLVRQTRLFYAAMESAYAALGAGHAAEAQALAGRLSEAAPDMAGPMILQADIAMRQQRWEDAARALGAVPREAEDEPHLRLKWFEYRCFTGDFEEAERLLGLLEATELPSRQFMLPILRFLAERQRWTDLVDRALSWLGADLRYDQIGYVLFRAAKRTARQADFLAAIEAIDDWQASPDLVRLHTALAWDCASSLADMSQVAAQPTTHASSAMRARMAVQRHVLARAQAPRGRRALFLCTNANYLCATIVALHSALQNSAPGREDCFIVVDDELAERTGRLVQPFRNQGFSVRVVPASQVIEGAERLYPTYGLFTSGHMLASAAYYRIFFARHLQKLGAYTRALYIDSDVLVRMPLDGLFWSQLDGHPLAARVETPRPEVFRAIALHKLRDDLYFNSGVLLFDLASDKLEAALDGAVAAIADAGTTLLFHDQCALNLGFRDSFQRLGMEWNRPVGEASPLADVAADTGILHFLDRPKPWSAAYDGECATLWFEQWRRTAEVIGEAQAVELFALNED